MAAAAACIEGEGSTGAGAVTTSAARSTLFTMLRESACKVCISRSLKALGRGEKISNTPSNLSSRTTGNTRMERTPRSRHISASTRESVSVSSQRCHFLLCTQAPESPECTSNSTPRSGALAPVVARQTISSPRTKAMAAAVAPVAKRACSTISFSTRSSAKSADKAPPPCADSAVASSFNDNPSSSCSSPAWPREF